MVDVSPKERITIRVPVSQIKYIAGKVELSYGEVVERIQEFLEYLKEKIITEGNEWIDTYVPKRTGQLRALLKLWLGGSTISKNVLRIVLGTNLPYAEDVNDMTTDMVQHSGETGYVYYPNIFGIRGKVRLNDPQAIGGFFTELMKYMEERTHTWIDIAKSHFFGAWKEAWSKAASSFDKTKKKLG